MCKRVSGCLIGLGSLKNRSARLKQIYARKTTQSRLFPRHYCQTPLPARIIRALFSTHCQERINHANHRSNYHPTWQPERRARYLTARSGCFLQLLFRQRFQCHAVLGSLKHVSTKAKRKCPTWAIKSLSSKIQTPG